MARRHLVVAVQRFPRGTWTPAADADARPLGFLVLAGGLIHGSCVGDRWSTEILGPGDVLRPWEEEQGLEELAVREEWQALESVELAVLDRRFVRLACRWPELVDELLARTVRRSRHLAMLRSIAGIRRLDDRLLVLLRILAYRWGRVCPEGVRLHVRLTHETLARLAGAQRPSVSTALARLKRDGFIARQGGVFILPASTPDVGPASDVRRGGSPADEPKWSDRG